jgi:beta-galactosidase GanA
MRKLVSIILALLVVTPSILAQPALKKHGDAVQMTVNGKPMLLLAGELGNSSSSSEAYLKDVWPKLKALNYNTILAAVTWELIEPDEGTFDFSSVDHLIKSAREFDMKLVLLWFASWKNAASTYIPIWVKTDAHGNQ